MSPSFTRFLATAAVMGMWALLTAVPAAAAPGDDNTWTSLGPLPQALDRPVFALAVNPDDGHQLVAGTAKGEIYRSGDRGASWRLVKSGLGRGVVTLAFNPFKPGTVLAGSRGAGIWRSGDGGLTWQFQSGTESRSVRAFSFTRNMTLAGTDQGIMVTRDGAAWTPAGLTEVTVSSLVAVAVNDPVRLVAGGDGSRGTEALPLFTSADGGQSWAPVSGTVGGSSMVAMLAAGPAASQQPGKSLLMGTNSGLFQSGDDGASWRQLTGGGALPATDFNAAAFLTNHTDRFYAASDGGSSELGGLWSTTDGGAHFSSLKPPVPSLTALAVSSEDTPTVYVASFRGSDHAVMLWSYRDTGGQPRPPANVPAPARNTVRAPAQAAPRPASAWLLSLTGPEAPYLALGALATMVLVLALVTHFRRARRL